MSLKNITNEITLKRMISAACRAAMCAARGKVELAAAPLTPMTGLRDSLLDAEIWTAAGILSSILPGVTQSSMVVAVKEISAKLITVPEHITVAAIEDLFQTALTIGELAALNPEASTSIAAEIDS